LTDWREDLFIKRSDLSIKILNSRWPVTEKLVDSIVSKLGEYGIGKGRVLDLCCGNGRISIHLARKGFDVVGVDFSRAFIEDARRRAQEYNVSDKCYFIEGDVRDLINNLRGGDRGFDLVVNAWTSIGYTTIQDDESIFRQAREVSRVGSIFMVLETMHVGRMLNQMPRNIFVDHGD
jgi:ubiquinone/menaquinone biosynthesis C-methylase UbiE